VDDFTKECLTLVADTSLSGARVARELDLVIAMRGTPICIVSDIRTIESDDTVYLDLGPVFEAWEADIGRTYALGQNEEKKRLVADLERVFECTQKHYYASPNITGAELYAFAQACADEAGWAFGGVIAGHVIGEFSHSTWPGEKDLKRIGPRNPLPMRRPDHLGRDFHWILEIHLVDHARTFGGFYERLL
jgi:hypothetical protein